MSQQIRPATSGVLPSSPAVRLAGQDRCCPRVLLALAILLAGIAFQAASVATAEEPFRAPAQLIQGARVWIHATGEFQTRDVLVRSGLIVHVAESIPQPADADVVSAKELYLYPGWIDAGTDRYLKGEPALESGRSLDVSRSALVATPGDHRKGLTPEYRAAEGFDAQSAAISKWREAGWLVAQVVPEKRIASGRATTITLSGAPPREAILVRDGLASFSLAPLGGDGYPATRMGTAAHLRQAFIDAAHSREQAALYAAKVPEVDRPEPDRVALALAEQLSTRAPMLFTADTRDDILRAIDFAAEHGLPAMILSGSDSDLCARELAQANVPVLLRIDFGDEPKLEYETSIDLLVEDRKEPVRWQVHRRAEWRRRVNTARTLLDHKVRVALCSAGIEQPADLRKAIRTLVEKGGITEAVAMRLLTQSAADLLGLGDRLGSIEPGKLATFFLSKQRLTDKEFKVDSLFLDGRRVVIDPAKPEAASDGKTPAASLGGEWLVTIEAGDRKQEATLDLIQRDGTLSGSFRSSQGEGKLSSGEIKGRTLTFVVEIGAGLQTLELKFEGATEGDSLDRLRGTLRSAFGAPAPWTAVRKAQPNTSTNAANPVALAIDDADPDKKSDKGTPASTATTNNPDPAEAPGPTDWTIELPSDRVYSGPRSGGQMLIRHAHVITVSGETLADTDIRIQNGKIAEIGKNLAAGPEVFVLDATGQYVMPGIIDTHSHIMFREQLGGVNEATLSIVPEVRVRDAIRSDDPAAFRALAGGVTTIRLLHGSANVIGGQDAVVKMKYGRPLRELFFPDAHTGVKFALGENVKFQSGRFPNTRLGVEATLQRAFLEAWEYRRRREEHVQRVIADGPEKPPRLAPRRDLRLEALAEILDQKKFIHSHCYRNDEILMLLRVASGFGIRVWSLQHVLEGYKVGPEIAAHGASASLFSDWWAYKHEAYDAIPYAPKLMLDAGVSVCLKSDDAELMRHLQQDAAKTLRYGVDSPETALRFITLNPAKQLGIDHRVGSIEVGKDADLAVFNGHPLHGFARCEQTIIDGEVWFDRSRAPSAMMGSAGNNPVGALPLAPAEQRQRTVEIPNGLGARYALVDAVVHPMDGPAYERGNLVVNNGRIEAIGREVAIPEGIPVIPLGGLHLYPGMIDAGCVVGLYEIGKARETNDFGETGTYQPDIRAAVAVNPDSELIAVTRAGGVTTCLVRPTGAVISGQASHVQLTGWTAPEMTRTLEAGLRIGWPTSKENRKEIDALSDFFDSAKRYLAVKQSATAAKLPGPLPDPRFDALAPYLEGKRTVFIAAHGRREIVQAIKFAEKWKLKLVLVGASDAWKLAPAIKERGIPVIVGPVMKGFVTPGHQPSMNDHDPFDAYYANAGRLHAAGVQLAFQSDDAANSRNLPFEAAMAVTYGLPADVAETALTLGAAKILGCDGDTGSLTVGKRADFIVTDGSPLQPTTIIKAVGVSGTLYPPTSRHTRLSDKYRARLAK